MIQAVTAPARIKVFWQPGCTSCLRTKEFLAKQGIEFESVNVHDNPAGEAELRALGARSVPVVSLGDKYTLCQSFNDVIKFLDLKTTLNEPLPPVELVDKLATILETAAQLSLQLTSREMTEFFRDRNRTPANTAFHAIRVAELGIEAAHGIELKFESFDDIAPSQWTREDIANYAISVRQRLLLWWDEQKKKDPTIRFNVPTYYGARDMHDVLERTAYHSAQHTRQVAFMLESSGIVPKRALTKEDLSGLPVPDEVWG